MKRFAIFLVLMFSAVYLLFAGLIWADGDEFFAKFMIYVAVGSVVGLAVITAVSFLLVEVLKGCWYLFDRVWPK